MSNLKLGAAVLAAGVLIVFAGTACAEVEEDTSAAAPAAETTPDAAKKAKKSPAEKAEAPAETAGQENARRSAESYLEFSAFSRKGLIHQLKFEGYSTKDATYAVDALSPNWNKQAAKSAKAYLDMSGFSRSGLIDQLEYEGFTPAQAEYGVNKAGL
jgi:hypothetical protein